MKVLFNFIRNALPGAHLVDIFPILDKLPDLLSPWRLQALKNGREELEVRDRYTILYRQTLRFNLFSSLDVWS